MRDLLGTGTNRGHSMIGTGIGLGLSGYRLAVAEPIYNVEYLVVGGGGGGTYGGGGGGGFRVGSDYLVNRGTSYPITVGAGGVYYANGNTSTFDAITSAGGGYGAGSDQSGANGGSGGGGASGMSGGTGNTPSVTPSQGNNGGASVGNASPYPAGGGGGAGAVGSDTSGSVAGNGGSGSASSISGSSTYYAGGGGGGLYSSGGTPGTGGLGGGGNGGDPGNAGSSGSSNTGGGGGGRLKNGGSGIVIIRYLGAQKATGGTVTSSGGYTIHTFNSSGTFVA